MLMHCWERGRRADSLLPKTTSQHLPHKEIQLVRAWFGLFVLFYFKELEVLVV